MNKKALVLFFSIVFTVPFINLYSQESGFGLGIMAGEPTGFSAKYWTDDSHAIDFGLAYSFVHPNKVFSLHGDYLFHFPNPLKTDFRFPLYYGVGARIHFGNKDGNTLGARGVIGVVWIGKILPLDAFIELAPVFNIFPETSLHLDCALGARYYFH
jgi:hypothetical protein